MYKIQENWENKKLHYDSGILFADSEFYPYDIINLKLNEQLIDKNIPRNCIDSYEWADIFIQDKLVLFDNSGQVFVGSGGLGSDGFIVFATNDNKLVWSIFSESTNGFIEVKQKGDILLVESGSGYNYSIPIENPLLIKRLKNKSPYNSFGERTNYKPYPM